MKKIVVLPGDGIGPEVTAQAMAVLKAVASRFSFELEVTEALIGGAAIDATGSPLPAATLEACRKASAVFLGAVGGPAWDELGPGQRPESGLLAIRKELGLFANLRPAVVYPELSHLSRLRSDLVENGVDLMVVRELTGDVYFGQPAGEEVRGGLRYGFNNMIYNEEEVRRIAVVAFELAKKRRKKVCSVDKANVLDVSRLWRNVVKEVHKNYPEIELEHMYVDNAAMQLISAPANFDVILTGNLFGDILSDEAAAVSGSLGLLPSASLSASQGNSALSFGLYEPIHGSAPDLVGQDKANPLASILSVGLMLRSSLGYEEAANCVENSVQEFLEEGYRTFDISRGRKEEKVVGCKEAGGIIVEKILKK